ncbi:MAG TPA: hypothetical protein VLL08_20830 [Kineosporiaceae bacterium]|nr:hypothetical protein [Kineosporiaceae bacterium]
MRTVYPFTLPRGYLGPDGTVHRDGTMRLATGRDELEPLRDPFVKGPDDPRLTMLVLARVVQRLGAIEYVTLTEIEGLFAADLAFLQDFYSVVNFGDQAEYEALLSSAGQLRPDLVVPEAGGLGLGTVAGPPGVVSIPGATGPAVPAASGTALEPGGSAAVGELGGPTPAGPSGGTDEFGTRAGRVLTSPTRRSAILEVAAAGGRT